MPMIGDIYRPDFQAQIPDIEWMPEDEQEQPDFSPLASALKRRFMKKPAMGAPGMSPHIEEAGPAGHEAMAGIGKAFGGGKMSL